MGQGGPLLFMLIQSKSIFNSIQFNGLQFKSNKFSSIQLNAIQSNSMQFNLIQTNSNDNLCQLNGSYGNNKDWAACLSSAWKEICQ